MEGDAHTVVAATVKGGPTVLVEVQAPADPEQDIGVGQLFSFDRLGESVQSIANSLAGALENARPDKAAIEFGLDVGVEAGALTALIAKGTGSATIKVTLEWDRPRHPPGTQ